MAYGEDLPDIDMSKIKHRVPKVENEPEEIDEFNEVLKDIEERKRFLDEMESLGQGKKYRSIIQTEISQKIRELELLDKKRTKELELALQAENLTVKES